MTVVKRGLGRGLEVLLADTANAIETNRASADDRDERLAEAQAMIESLQQENQALMADLEKYKALLVELEAIIRINLNQIQP